MTRKKIGLALSGGGARGFAHVGVLTALATAAWFRRCRRRRSESWERRLLLPSICFRAGRLSGNTEHPARNIFSVGDDASADGVETSTIQAGIVIEPRIAHLRPDELKKKEELTELGEQATLEKIDEIKAVVDSS